MLQPKRVKYRRPHGLSHEGPAKAGTNVDFGEYGLQAQEGCYLTDHQIEAARIVLARYTDRAGKIWIRIFPQMAKTRKPAEVRMGSGKGNPEGWVAVVKTGRMLFEIGGIADDKAKEALKMAGYKLPIHTKIIKRTKALSEAEKLKMEAAHASSLDEIKLEDSVTKETVSDTGNETPAEGAVAPAAGATAAAAAPATDAKAAAPAAKDEKKKGE
jgi:large subunit ribosomal protein L16